MDFPADATDFIGNNDPGILPGLRSIQMIGVRYEVCGMRCGLKKLCLQT
jgi:hypothetical protein